MSYLSRERVRSTFMEDFRAFMEEAVPANRRMFDWHDPVHDRMGITPKPILVHALPTEDLEYK